MKKEADAKRARKEEAAAIQAKIQAERDEMAARGAGDGDDDDDDDDVVCSPSLSLSLSLSRSLPPSLPSFPPLSLSPSLPLCLSPSLPSLANSECTNAGRRRPAPSLRPNAPVEALVQRTAELVYGASPLPPHLAGGAALLPPPSPHLQLCGAWLGRRWRHAH